MRLKLIAAFGLSAAVLAGCVAPVPVPGPALPQAPVAAPAPTTLDAASRQVARNTIQNEIQNRFQGVDVAPWTDCVMNNATTAELIDIAQMSNAGSSGVSQSVAAIVSRPATTQCIAAAARRT
ncbi:hypothetical protein [Paracoccus sp. (in: a-proteobacteria)]|uniref:hypothetical protein n=1 Tax=Paracoccus sp. TaxID=267 RepID=UPI00272B1AB8|nr:hypothetical protein [Paracoccus sp. (in: a-proteobacteria)]